MPRRRPRARRERVRNSHQRSPVEETDVSIDTLFDGLCYLGHGSWPAFQRLAAAVSPEPWFAQSVAGDLHALGHLEMRGSLVSRGGEWSIAPPALVVGMDGNAYLSGFQPTSLHEAVSEALAVGGATYSPVRSAGQPTVHRWTGLNGLDLETLVTAVRDAHGRPVKVSRGLATAISLGSAQLFRGLRAGHADPCRGGRRAGQVRHPRGALDTGGPDGGGRGLQDRPTRNPLRLPGRKAVQRGRLGTRWPRRLRPGQRATGCTATTWRGAPSPPRSALNHRGSTRARSWPRVEGLPRVEDGRVQFDRVEPAVAATILNKMYGKDEIIG